MNVFIVVVSLDFAEFAWSSHIVHNVFFFYSNEIGFTLAGHFCMLLRRVLNFRISNLLEVSDSWPRSLLSRKVSSWRMRVEVEGRWRKKEEENDFARRDWRCQSCSGIPPSDKVIFASGTVKCDTICLGQKCERVEEGVKRVLGWKNYFNRLSVFSPF